MDGSVQSPDAQRSLCLHARLQDLEPVVSTKETEEIKKRNKKTLSSNTKCVCVSQVLRQEALEAHQPAPLQVHHPSDAEWHYPEAASSSGPQLDQHLQETAELAHQQAAR